MLPLPAAFPSVEALAQSQGWDLGLIAILTAISVLLLAAVWFLPKWQASRSAGTTPDNGFERENEARKTIAQIVGGIVLLAGLYSSSRTLALQTEATQIQGATLNATKDGQITERYTKAVEQLGASQDDKHPKVEGLKHPAV